MWKWELISIWKLAEQNQTRNIPAQNAIKGEKVAFEHPLK